MKTLGLIAFLFPMFVFAQVGVGDLNMSCSGSAGSMQLTKRGRSAYANGVPMQLGRDGYYRDSSGHLLTIQVMSSDNSALVYVFNPNGTRVGSLVCQGEVHRYRLRYDKKGFPTSVIVPADSTPANSRYRCVYSHDGAPVQDCGN